MKSLLIVICGGLCTTALWGQTTNVFPSTGDVGIGTTAPTYTLDVRGTIAIIDLVGKGYGYQPGIYLQRADGTATAPTALAAGDIMGEYSWSGYDGSSSSVGGAGIRAQASQAFTSSAHGTNLSFYTTPTNSNSSWQNYPRMTITANGSVGIGTTTPGYQLDVQGGQINSSGGYCINGTNCITSWPTGGGGSGTVTSITAGSGLLGGTITTSGTLSLNLNNANTWLGVQSFGANATFAANSSFPGGIWNSSGNVGISTTTPRRSLDVRGEIVAVNRMTLAQDSGVTTNTWHVDNAAGLFRLFWQPNINTAGTVVLAASTSGNVGIGTTTPAHLLHVAGTIGAEEVIVSATGADYVFDPGYHLAPLSEVASYINEHHHLPDIPSASDMQQKGANVGEMQAKLLAKIEELTLHMIQAEERSNRLEQQNRDLQERIDRLESQSSQAATN